MQKQFLALGTLFSVAAAAHAQQTNPYQPRLPLVFHDVPASPDVAATIQLQPRLQLALPVLPPISAAKGLAAVAGETDVFTLAPGTYDSKELLELLASRAGGKAIFVDGFKSKSLDFLTPLIGTAPELIKKLRNYGIAAGKLGSNWVFMPDEDKTSSPSGVTPRFHSGDKTPNLKLYSRLNPPKLHFSVPALPPKNVPLDGDFNKMPNPGQSLPHNATPFDFNGNRLYHVPLQPTQK